MAEKTFKEIMSNPARDYCTGRLLSVALELARAGYTHRDISQSALEVARTHALEEGFYHYAHYCRMLEELGKHGIETLDMLYEESEKNGTLLKR